VRASPRGGLGPLCVADRSRLCEGRGTLARAVRHATRARSRPDLACEPTVKTPVRRGSGGGRGVAVMSGTLPRRWAGPPPSRSSRDSRGRHVTQ